MPDTYWLASLDDYKLATSPEYEAPDRCPRCDMSADDCDCDRWPEDAYDTLEEKEMDR